MLNFVFRKMKSKKWMVISLLIGNLFMIAIAAVSPMYSQAVLQRTLLRRFSDSYIETDRYPGTILQRGQYTGSKNQNKELLRKLGDADRLIEELTEELGIPVLSMGVQYYKNNVKALHETVVDDGENEVALKLSSYSGIADQITIVNGEMYAEGLKNHTFDVIVNERTFVHLGFMLGEELELPSLKDEAGIPYRIRIAGIFEMKEELDSFLISDPAGWNSVCLMDDELALELFTDSQKMGGSFGADWTAVLDYTKIRGDQAEHYLSVLERYLDPDEGMQELNGRWVYFQKVLEQFTQDAKNVNTTIVVLQIPIFVLLAAFIFMVSRQMLEMEQNEIAVYKSRGADKKQIVLLYLLQSVVISVLGLLGGIPLSVLMCRVLGASNSFLEFVKRTALQVEVGPKVWLFAVAAAFFSVCTMVLPVIGYADVNIVAHKRGKNRSGRRPWWQKIFLDVVLLASSLYGLYHFRGQKEYLVLQVQEGGSLDPLLYFSSSLFLIGSGLLILRIFPLVVRGVYGLGKRWWSPAFYASFLRILRARDNRGFLMVFLVLTMSMGIFNAQAARTINASGEERIRYSTGADLVLQEVWKDNSESAQGAGSVGSVGVQDVAGTEDLVYQEPDFGKYQIMEGIESVTKVLVNKKIKVSVEGGSISNAMLMGIHTKEFGETAWFKEDLLPVHWYEYLNAISQNSRAILVSSNFRELYGYEIGDVLTYSNEKGASIRGIIYGFVDYWPSYAPVTQKKVDGIWKETDNFLIVANLSQLQSSWGVTPYQVWIKTEGSSQFIYDYAEASGTKYTVFEDASAKLIELKNDPVFQGTNGILTVGFVCVLLVCIAGFLIYWILSIQSRTLQFGVFCAMGMSMKEVLLMLFNEQFFITGISMMSGVLVGILASNMFIPLIQIAYTSSEQVIPLEIVSEGSDYVRLFVVVGLAFLICMCILGGLISKIKISQALKLGED